MRLITLAFALLASAPALADGDAEFKQQVESLVKQYIGGVNNKNVDAVLAVYASDPVFLRPDGVALHGEAEIRKLVSGAVSQGLHDDAAVTEAHRYGNSGFAIGTFTDTYEGKPM